MPGCPRQHTLGSVQCAVEERRYGAKYAMTKNDHVRRTSPYRREILCFTVQQETVIFE